MSVKGRIVVIDDEVNAAAALETLLQEDGYEVARAHDARTGLQLLEQIEPDIDIDDCNGCGLCANCIHGGISMQDGEPLTHLELCVRCGVCESICPTDAITMQVQ